MKIWIDILTPKQLLFTESLIEKFGNKHNILCTSRTYPEVTKLAKIRNFRLISVGRHGGFEKASKLKASVYRMEKLIPLITKFSPELIISFCSPEAARISFGLGIKHIAFCDSPHASAVMKLTLPFIQKLLTPKVIPKEEFSKYGINNNDIIQYNAIDAYVTIKRKPIEKNNPFKKLNRKNILIRVVEEEASYTSKSNKLIPILKQIIKKYNKENIVVLGRYDEQIKNLKKIFGMNVTILKMSFDGKMLLNNTDVFIGSGGTMTAESALLGIPTISYNGVPNIIEKYLVSNNLVKRETDPEKIVKIIEKTFRSPKEDYKKRASKFVQIMEDPIDKLNKIM